VHVDSDVHRSDIATHHCLEGNMAKKAKKAKAAKKKKKKK